MTERPIIFSGAMVRAILDGRKTMTRRVVKDVNYWHIGRHISDWPLSKAPTLTDNVATFEIQSDVDDTRMVQVRYPYGAPGDRLWVRETMHEMGGLWRYSADNEVVGCDHADEAQMIVWSHHRDRAHCPSIHMPRWASRLTLEIVGVRVERVQDISEADARAEGVAPVAGVYRYQFSYLWDSINDKRGYGWQSNPWVWVVEFKRQGD